MADRILFEFLHNLQLSDDEIKLYTILVEFGPQTILELSRHAEINRTQVYRLCQQLQTLGIVEHFTDDKKSLVKAASYHTLEFIVKQRESALRKLTESLPYVENYLFREKKMSQPGTKILFYRGKDGIQQQLWNILRAQSECMGFTTRELSDVVGDWHTQWVEEFVFRKLTSRDIYSHEYLKNSKDRPTSPFFPKKYFKRRYIDSKILNITHQVILYNDVVSYYDWHDGEIFGVELYNQHIANFQKQLFEIIWNMSEEKTDWSLR